MKKRIILILSWPESRSCWSHELKFRSAVWHSHWPTFTHFVTNELFRTDKAEYIRNKFRKQNLLLCRKTSMSKGLYFNLCYFNLAAVLLEKMDAETCSPGRFSKTTLNDCWSIYSKLSFLFQPISGESGSCDCRKDILFFTKTASTLHIHAI